LDLVRDAGVDVSDWGNFEGGVERAATNPRYCYEWAFVNPGQVVVCNLWYQSLHERVDGVTAELNLRAQAAAAGKGVWRTRAERLDRAITQAARERLPVRIIVNDGAMRDAIDPESTASQVAGRLLDPVPWSVARYDSATGACVLLRGVLPGNCVDQFAFSAPANSRTVEAVVYIRDPGVRSRALDRSGGCCEHCGASGFAMENGKVYLETHHIVPLCEGGPDTDENVVALCPNHHREAHYGANQYSIQIELLQVVRRRLARSQDPGPAAV
jgi:5-methylcytosine-specific restriction protein A